jgi:hypothetical protein
LPSPLDCHPLVVADALDFLVNQWLCDVAADFASKCVLISLALTIIERVLLPERPAYFVTAGKRGGGKTTTLIMLILAVTGKKPPAAAWSRNEEERRKAMLAYLSEALAVLVWDNIPLGTAISCPTLEKVLTNDTYSDRLLGQSASITVPAHTIMCFTGNNIGPKGDLASRSLIARLEVNRPDPENRTFTHADPIAWTLDNRGAILRALYTILLGNPQLQPEHRQAEKTRFKRWWHLVGSAVERASAELAEQQRHFPLEEQKAMAVDFGVLFAGVEDEDTIGLTEVLHHLHDVWQDGKFQAADVAKLINATEGEHKRTSALREFFGAATRHDAELVKSLSIGHRLGAMAGAPVRVDDRIVKLVRSQPDDQAKKRRTAWFQVKVTRDGCE